METELLKRRLLWVLFILACLALGYVGISTLLYVRPAVVLLSVCILVAYLLVPLVGVFERVLPGTGHTRRLISILLSYLLIGTVVAVFAAYVVPMAGREFHHLTTDLASLRDRHVVDELTDWLTDKLPPEQAEAVPTYVQGAIDQLQQLGLTMLKSSMPYVTQVFSTVVEIFLIPLFTLFILLDLDTYKKGFLRVVPRHRRADTEKLLSELNVVLAGFVHGQMMVACVMGTSIAIVLWLLDVPYALLLGTFAGLVDIIPYLGVPLGMIPAFFSALSSHGFLWALLTIGLMEILHMTEGKVVVPTVVGHTVKL
ncbi:MAG TPA: AI-2E family transporter, partial [Candidatus Xenobia bacterium]